MRSAASCELGRFEAQVWRFVDAQKQVSTAKLTSSAVRQHALEDLLETTKPPRRDTIADADFLLWSPLRYPPLRYGSRFGTRAERSIWYASRAIPTSLAECAYYAYYFRSASRASLGRRSRDITLIRVALASGAALDLTTAPFLDDLEVLRSPTSYRATQAIGAIARERDADLIVYVSARCPAAGHNVGVLSERAFLRPVIEGQQQWSEVLDDTVARYSCKSVQSEDSCEFPRTLFEIDGVVPAPAP